MAKSKVIAAKKYAEGEKNRRRNNRARLFFRALASL